MIGIDLIGPYMCVCMCVCGVGEVTEDDEFPITD